MQAILNEKGGAPRRSPDTPFGRKPSVKQLILAALAGTMLAPVAATAQQVPNAQPDMPVSSSDRFYTSTSFPTPCRSSIRDQPAARRHQAGRSDADEPQPAVSRAVAGPRHGLLARPADARCRVDRIECGQLHRHRHQQRAAHHLCRPQPTRGLLPPRWPGGLGQRARRGLYRRPRWHDLQGDRAHSVPNGPGMTIFSPDGKYGYVCSSFSPETLVIDTASKQIVGRVKQKVPSAPTSPRRPMASRSG